MAIAQEKRPGRRARDLSAFQAVVWADPEGECDHCGAPLRLQQHRLRALQLLGSKLLVTQKDRCCSNSECCDESATMLRPQVEETKLVIKGCEYGLDVVALVGERHMLGHRSFREIHEELTQTHKVSISSRHVPNLFRLYLAIVGARTLNSKAVQERLSVQKELILSVDAVRFDDVSPPLYVVREVNCQEILLAERIEKADTASLVAFLNKLSPFKASIAGLVSDKEKALITAVDQVFPGVPHQYCQTHFFSNLVRPMESDLSALSSEVDTVVKSVRELSQRLDKEKASGPGELELAKMVCDSVQIIGKARGDKLFEPAALTRYQRLTATHARVDEALEKRTGTESWPLLIWLLYKLEQLKKWSDLAGRLSRQVTVIREISRLLNVDARGKTVQASLRKYLKGLQKEASRPQTDEALTSFLQHVIAVTERFWPGLFACYDLEGLPSTNNELESFFRTLKWHQRRVQGKKSTAGGLLESFAPLLVQLWPMLKRRPDLQALFEGLSYEEIQSLQERITSLSEPARARRSFRRDSDTQLEQALAKWSAE